LSWAGLAGRKLIFLTTRGRRTGKPHSVELWFAVLDDKIYLSHEGRHTDWMKNLQKYDKVNFRIGDSCFSGVARIVAQKEGFNKGKHALYAKYYGKASDSVIDDWFTESTVVEISSVAEEKENN
jgi:deazaflavin-dependent oxidoreductase (nitroreductase family)